MKTCFMFSGQGAQYDKMGLELFENYPICREVFQIAENSTGINLADICFKQDSRLNETEYTQPAILAVSYAIFKILEEKGLKADFMTGLSLGEYSALCASNALDFSDAVSLVRKRGKFMTEAVPLGVGAMSAVLNASEEDINEVISKVSCEGSIVSVANYNAPGQIVIAGHLEAVEKAEKLLIEKGIKKIIRLNVSGPFHTTLLKPASEKLEKELDNINIKTPQVPVITNLTADIVTDIKETLIKQIMSPVKWQQSINKLLEYGVDTFIEIGPGKVLSAFVKKIDRSVKVYNVEDINSLEKTYKEMGLI